MNWSLLKGYVLVVASGLVIFAAVLLMIFNGGSDPAKVSIYGWRLQVNVGQLMAFCALGGIMLYFCLRMMISGMGSFKKGRQEQTMKNASKISDLLAESDRGKPV